MTAHSSTPLAAVLWDMDGTIVDSEPAWIRAQAALAAEHGARWGAEDAQALIGSTMEQTVRSLQSAGVALDDESVAERLENEVIAALHEGVSWRPGALELLRETAAAGVPQAIVTTSSRRLAEVVVAALGVALATVVTGDDVRHGKPDPEPYLLAAERLGVAIAACVAIEDSPTGLAAAIASGATAVGVPHDAVLEEGADRTLLSTLAGTGVEDLRRLVARRAE
ncbi:HAD family hydrolase [Rathayibacter tanaceti]|uniref:HAD-IA family hydrolase n=2 Tax=Rathayibacter tanaceti TaxID=1671680 RepID=A0A162IZC0_9MICO|nr:HAD family phosphatase [Rathayibacter tanaceti]KZX19977.1 Phosphorylated carbohydrates phosphatase [Rathayibacter tanaceti]QHC54859.1 HAD-IA family hydrolase [Rathayibacter tanaceti]TCO38394.1 HAD superfamily hydrolase (TIGR01509 family)/HAD superfamily hydrolase (TIGR01549 family) [Rathayibacter tanaceti]